MKKIIVGFPLMLLLGCDADDDEAEGDANDDGEAEARDERVPIPPEDPNVLTFMGAEFVVEPGEERMVCTYVTYDGPDAAYNDVIGLQGKGGHHAILLRAKEPKADGEFEDCTDAADMAKYDVLTIPQKLPEGHGSFMPTNRTMVIQSHYVNANDVPILVRDIVQLPTLPIAEVETWAAPFVTNTFDFTIAPGESKDISFDCEVPKDVDLLMIGGHMHEWGTKFSLELGETVEAMETMYLVDPWKAEFRDIPPVTLFFSAPQHITAGTKMRTTCGYTNAGSEPLEFPHEMCAAFGMVAGTKDPIVCGTSE